MPSPLFQTAFNSWLDSALSQPIPASVVAFSFNLAEPWSIEVVGSDSYSEDDSDWACDESFRPKIANFDLPESEVGEKWESVLASAKKIVSYYIDRPSNGSAILKRAEAVAVGFVDGDLDRIWPRQKTELIPPQSTTPDSDAHGRAETSGEQEITSAHSELMHQVGAFEPHEAKRVLALFEARKIPFEIEADNSALADSTRPLQLYFGMYPAGSKLAVFVPESKLEEAAQALLKLFPV